MNEKLRSFLNQIETTMACVAFAEANEACPIGNELKGNTKRARCLMTVRDTMACSAYAEAGEPCPICEPA